MNKTKIEWCDYTINPIKGMCKNTCWYCYAKAMYKRFGWDKTISYDPDAFYDVGKAPFGSKIFVGSTHDIFGNWIEKEIIEIIISWTKIYPKHTFIFLTKFPERMVLFKFPKNCWVGTSITGVEENQSYRHGALSGMDNIKFISYEPLLGRPQALTNYLSLDWIIIGGLTPKPVHQKEWIEKILICAELVKVPVFIKDNLNYPKIIRQYPISENRNEAS